MRPIRLQPILLALAGCALVPVALAQNPEYEPSNATDPKTCSSVDGPHKQGTGTYFNAENRCAVPLHCRVWVNWEEPPMQVHLEPGMRGRIDIGATTDKDKFSHDCVTPGVSG